MYDFIDIDKGNIGKNEIFQKEELKQRIIYIQLEIFYTTS